jgi:hypothetical protein
VVVTAGPAYFFFGSNDCGVALAFSSLSSFCRVCCSYASTEVSSKFWNRLMLIFELWEKSFIASLSRLGDQPKLSRALTEITAPADFILFKSAHWQSHMRV